MARLAFYTLKYIDKSAGYKHDLFSDGPDFNMTNFWADRQRYLGGLFANDDAVELVGRVLE